MRSSISLAPACASASARSGVHAEREEGDEPVGRVAGSGARGDRRRSPRGRSARTLSTRSRGRRATRRPAAGSASGSRCVWTRVDLGHGRRDLALDARGDLVRLGERERAGQLQVERDLRAVADLEHDDVVDLADARDAAARPRARARAAPRPPPRGSTWTTTSAPGHRALDRLLDRVGGGVALLDRRPRRDADDDVGEMAPGGAAHAEPPELDRRLERLDRRGAPPPPAPAGARSMSTSTFWRIEPRGRREHEHGDEERRERVALRVPGPRGEEADEHGDRAGEVAAEVERVRAERRARVASRAAR